MEKTAELIKQITERLNRRPARIDKADRLWDAAVLVPLIDTKQGPAVLFEVRAAGLGWQPGDVCFPGGRYECGDDSFAKTAVRETCEELGITEDKIELCGELDYLVTHMGPIIHPFVGRLANEVKLDCNSDEVAEIFTVPLNFYWFLSRALLIWNWQTAQLQIFLLICCRAIRTTGISGRGIISIFTNIRGMLSGGLQLGYCMDLLSGFIKNCRLIFCNWVWERKKRIEKLILLIVAAIAAASYLVYAYMNGDPMFGTLAKTMDDLPRNERLGSKRNIVVLGVDGREKDDDPGRSDTLFVVMFDPKSKNVSLLSIPRDTRVRIPGHGWDKINHAYAFGGHKLTQQTTEELLGIQVNNYVMVDFSGFESLVDAIGGIDIDVEKDMYYYDDWDDFLIDLPAGQQHLDGKKRSSMCAIVMRKAILAVLSVSRSL